MDGQEYLNQISASTRPVEQSKLNGILSSKFFLIGAIAVVALIVIIIIGSLLGGNKSGEKDESINLFLHMNNTMELINNYQPSIGSSKLRSSSSSLYGVLSNNSKELEKYLIAKYNFKEKDVDEKITQQATFNKEDLDEELYEAKINGTLDRVFAHKMAYEIEIFMAEKNKVLKVAKSDDLGEMLEKFNSSLENLYDSFNDFSEAK